MGSCAEQEKCSSYGIRTFMLGGMYTQRDFTQTSHKKVNVVLSVVELEQIICQICRVQWQKKIFL